MSITDLIEREYGGRNWVVARRTTRILRKFGDDVICLSSKRLSELERQFEIENAGEHPAVEVLMRNFPSEPLGMSFDEATAVVRTLREAGFRIEKIYGSRWA